LGIQLSAAKPQPVPRRRGREGAGKSDHSWIKHEMIGSVVGAQVAAFRRIFPDARMALIDGNAGGGVGVETRQADLFDGVRHSRPTPRLLTELARNHDAAVCLCERDRAKRNILTKEFPAATVVSSHREAAAFAVNPPFQYALWLSDPCGYSGHGIEHMRAVALTILRSDFVIVLNQGALERALAVNHSPYWRAHQKYTPMLQPPWWLQQIPKRFLARSDLVKQSSNFHFRLLVVSDFLTDGVRRMRKVEIITRQQKDN
jgi:hypothetical protein